MTELLILSRCTADESIRERILDLLAVLRSSLEPVGRVARLWRWCRRNRIVASLLATLGVLLVLGAVGWQHHVQTKATAEADAAAQQVKQILEARTRAHVEMLALLEKARGTLQSSLIDRRGRRRQSSTNSPSHESYWFLARIATTLTSLRAPCGRLP